MRSSRCPSPANRTANRTGCSRAGSSPGRPPGSRDTNSATVDLAQIDIDGLGRLLAEAPGLVRLPSVHIDRIMVRAEGDAPATTVYVTDSDDRQGYVTANLAGEVLYVRVSDQ